MLVCRDPEMYSQIILLSRLFCQNQGEPPMRLVHISTGKITGEARLMLRGLPEKAWTGLTFLNKPEFFYQ